MYHLIFYIKKLTNWSKTQYFVIFKTTTEEVYYTWPLSFLFIFFFLAGACATYIPKTPQKSLTGNIHNYIHSQWQTHYLNLQGWTMEGSSLLSHSCCSSPTLKPHLSFSLSFTLSSSSSSSLLFGKSHLLGLIQRPLLATVSLSSPRTSLRTSTFTLDEALEKPNSDSREMLPKIDKSGRFCSPRAARELAL